MANSNEENDDPEKEDSGDFENEPTGQDNSRFKAGEDEVEGTKNFDRAYDKLIKKFYHEEGANLLIPSEDMVMHEYNIQNRVKVDVDG